MIDTAQCTTHSRGFREVGDRLVEPQSLEETAKEMETQPLVFGVDPSIHPERPQTCPENPAAYGCLCSHSVCRKTELHTALLQCGVSLANTPERGGTESHKLHVDKNQSVNNSGLPIT